MSYLRGDTYIWSSGDRVHIWVADGYDGWDDSGWGQNYDTSEQIRASGVGINEITMDEFVMMRLAQMVERNLVDSAIDRAIEHGKGNGGCESLVKNAEGLKSALSQ